MNLVRASLENAAALAAVHATGFDAPWPEPEIAGLIDGLGAYGFLVEDDGPVGMILCRAAAGEVEILTLAVDPAVRRRGVARALIAAALDAARAQGADAAFLEVAVDNDAALALYARLGFQAAGVRPGYYDRGPLGRADARIMRLDLNAAAS